MNRHRFCENEGYVYEGRCGGAEVFGGRSDERFHRGFGGRWGGDPRGRFDRGLAELRGVCSMPAR